MSAAAALIAVLVGTTLAPFAAHAGPWVLPKKHTLIGITAGAGFASREFLPDGKQQDLPLNGSYRSFNIELLSRVGVGRGFEVFLKTAVKGVSYVADPVILFNEGSAPEGLAGHRDAIFNFSAHRTGLADLHIGAAHQHLSYGPLRLASLVELKIPTGYVTPRETFRNDGDPNTTDLTPDAIADDVTIGDGQVDLEYSLQFGAFLPATRTVLELNAGYRARFNGPGHQFIGLAKVGQFIGRHILLYASFDTAITLFQGTSIGSTYIAIDPSVPASDFPPGLQNIRTETLRIDRDQITVAGGAIVRVLKREWVLRVFHTPWGKNTAKITGFNLGVLLPFGGPDE